MRFQSRLVGLFFISLFSSRVQTPNLRYVPSFKLYLFGALVNN